MRLLISFILLDFRSNSAVKDDQDFLVGCLKLHCRLSLTQVKICQKKNDKNDFFKW